MAKGLRLDVYRCASGGDFTNGGITAHAARVTVTGVIRPGGPGWTSGHQEPEPLPKDMQVFEPTEIAPEVTLVIRAHGRGTWLHLEPVGSCPAGNVGWMMGGNYAGTSDSRWGALTDGTDLVAIHDRTETQAQYDYLSV